MATNKKDLKKQNKRLNLLLNNEREVMNKLRNSLDVMQAGWSSDKEKLKEALEKLDKLNVTCNTNNDNKENSVLLKKNTPKKVITTQKEGSSACNIPKTKLMTQSQLRKEILEENEGVSHLKSLPKRKIKSSQIPVNQSNFDVKSSLEKDKAKNGNNKHDCIVINKENDWTITGEDPLTSNYYRKEKTSVISCPFCCNESFPTQDSLKYHLLSIFENVFCPICSQRYDDVMSLISHLGKVCNGQPKFGSDDYKQMKCSEDVFTIPQNTLAIISFKMSNAPTDLSDMFNGMCIMPDNEDFSTESYTEFSNSNKQTSDDIQEIITTQRQYEPELEKHLIVDKSCQLAAKDEGFSAKASENVLNENNQTSDDIKESTINQQQYESEFKKHKTVEEMCQLALQKTEKSLGGNSSLLDDKENHSENIPVLNPTSDNILDKAIQCLKESIDLDSKPQDSLYLTKDVNDDDIYDDVDMNTSPDLDMPDNINPSDCEYHCSSCDMKFMSIADHIVQYHMGEEVQVQGQPEELKERLSQWNVIDGEVTVTSQEDQIIHDEENKRLSQIIDKNEICLNQNVINETDEDFTTSTGYWTKIGLFYKFVSNEEKMKLLDPTFVRPVVKLTTNCINQSTTDIDRFLWIDGLNVIQLVEDKDVSVYYKNDTAKVNMFLYIIDKETPINRDNLGPVAKFIDKFPVMPSIKGEGCNVEQASEDCEADAEKLLKNKAKCTNFINLLEVQLGSDQEITIENIEFKELPMIPENIVPFVDKVVQPFIPLLERAKILKWRCTLCMTSFFVFTRAVLHTCYKCKYCDKKFMKKINVIKRHFLEAHPDLNISKKLKSSHCSLKSTGLQIKDSGFIECEICKINIKKETLELHKKWHEENKYVCRHCNKTYVSELECEIHKKTHEMKFPHNEEYVCNICKKGFPNKVMLRSHLLQHDGTYRPHVCQYCFKQYSLKTEKDIHERLHTHVWPYTCKECGKCFRKQHCLRQHCLRHSNNKPFKCTVCNKSFFSSVSLKAHMLTHSTEKKYKCPYCHKRFKTLNTLIAHKNQHVLPFKCPFCPLAYSNLASVRKHMKLHDPGVTSFDCLHCPAVFRQKHLLLQHEKEAHNIESKTTKLKRKKKKSETTDDDVEKSN